MSIPDPALKAKILRATATAIRDSDVDTPLRIVLADVAQRHNLTTDAALKIVQIHGWPKTESMDRAASILEKQVGTSNETPAAPAARGAEPDAVIVDEATPDEQVYETLPIDQLHPDPANVRDDLGDLTELAKSITDVGILQPIVTRRLGDKLIIVMGHRRHAAAKLAGLHRVPVLIRPGTMDPDEVLAAMIIENGQRLDLDPIEEARALARLKRNDRSTDLELAGQISKSQAYVSGRLALLSLTPPQQAAVRAGTLPLARAVQLGREQGGITRPAAKGKKSAAHLTWEHPLAERAALSCETLKHHKNHAGRPGGVACGSCWEDVIRTDERTKLGAAR